MSDLALITVIKKGFTLAEILVTLVIIGIVASITIPNMLQNIQDATLKESWKKTFSDFSQATSLLARDKAGDLTGVFTHYNTAKEAYLPYLNNVKNCDAFADGCTYSTYSTLSGATLNKCSFAGCAQIVLNSGVILNFDIYWSGCTGNYSPISGEGACLDVKIDVNGIKPPNKVGKDIFAVQVLKTGRVFPYGSKGDYFYNHANQYSCDVNTHTSTEGWNCSADFILNKVY